MSIEDLLLPRYKVIADYPGSDYHVGEILDRDWGWVGNDDIGFKHRISGYPHLFRKLQWYEERKIEDMPQYVKLVFDSKIQFVHKVEKWIGANEHGEPLYEYFNRVGYLGPFNILHQVPATLTEYNEYISKQTT